MPPPPRNKALLRPYFLGGGIGGAPLNSHDIDSTFVTTEIKATGFANMTGFKSDWVWIHMFRTQVQG